MYSRSVFRISDCILIAALILTAFQAPTPARAQIYDWQPAAGPEGGAVYDLVETPDGTIYAGLWFFGGVYRSTDGGATWAEAGLQSYSIPALIVNGDGDVFAAGYNTRVYRLAHGSSVWETLGNELVDSRGALAYDPDLDILYAGRRGKLSRSLDGGDTWEEVSTNFPQDSLQALAAVPGGGPLFAGFDSEKVWRSFDGGVTWNPFHTGFPANWACDFLIDTDQDAVYVGTYGGYVCTAPWSGDEWTTLATGLDDRFCLSIGRDQAGSLWVGTINSGTFVSHNDGQNWAAARSGLGFREIKDIAFLGSGDYLAAANAGGIFRSTNSGATWASSCSGLYRSPVEDLLTDGAGTVFAAVQGNGVHRSVDGGATWNVANDGIDDFECTHLALHPDGTVFAGSWDGGVFESTNGGITWSPVAGLPAYHRVGVLEVDPATGDLYLGGLASGGLWRSPDKGATWTEVTGDLPFDTFTSLVVEEDGDLVTTSYDVGIYRSQNGGVNWLPLNTGLAHLNVSQVLSLPGGPMFAAVPYYGLHRSLDDGANWNLVDGSLESLLVQSLAVNENGFIFAGIIDPGSVYRSVDGGETWAQVSAMWDYTGVMTLEYDSDGRLLAGLRDRGVMYTVDSTPVQMQVFTAVRSGPGTVTVRWSLAGVGGMTTAEVHRSNGDGPRRLLSREVFSGGRDFTFTDAEAPDEVCSYWLRLVAEVGDPGWYGPVQVDKADAGPGALSIRAVWPNPATGAAQVRFSVPRHETARLAVYDLRGRLVRELRRGAAGPSEFVAGWDGCDHRGRRVSSGTYLLRLQAGSRVVSGKIVLTGGGP